MKQQSFLRMVMVTVWAAAVAGASACNKPSPESCRKAILNIQVLLGTDKSLGNFDLEGEVRRCRGGSTRKNVQCATNAASIEELRKCEGWESATYRAATVTPGDSVMSAGAGSAAVGSNAAMGSGSAAPPVDAGSASGSATGSASGSATGSGSAAATN